MERGVRQLRTFIRGDYSPIPYRTRPSRRPRDDPDSQKLRDGFFLKKTLKRLQAELNLLVPPLPGIRDFKIELESDEFRSSKGN